MKWKRKRLCVMLLLAILVMTQLPAVAMAEMGITAPTEGIVKPSGTVDNNGNVKAVITDQDIQDAIEIAAAQSKKDGKEANGITVSTDLNKLPLTLSRSAYKKLVDAAVNYMSIKTPQISLSLDLETLKTIYNASGGDVTIDAVVVDQSKLTQAAKTVLGNYPAYDLTVISSGKTISSFGGYVTVTLPYTLQADEEGGNLQMVWVDDEGNVQYITDSSYDADSSTMIGRTNHFTVFGITRKPTVFNDIAGHWAKDDILFAASRGLLNGTGEKVFSPNTGMTRGMFATALYRLAGSPQTAGEGSVFTDVSADAYYAGAVKWASSKGIVNGTTATTFAPDQDVTRQEMAAIMVNYAKIMGYTLPRTREAVTFTDNASIVSWAADAVKAMQMAGVLMGKDGNCFDPTGTATRAEVSAVLHRYVELVIDPQTAQSWDRNDSSKWMYYVGGKPTVGIKTIDGTTYHFDDRGQLTKIDPVAPESKQYTNFVVSKNDTLWGIAASHGCTVAEIVYLNNITDPNLTLEGQTLKLPQKSDSSHSSSSGSGGGYTPTHPTPSVNSVTVTPETVTAAVGMAITGQQLTANVSVTGSASQDVVWSVHDAGTTGTGKVTVDADGKLNVAADAAIGTAVIRATSTYDSTKYGICTVSVSATPTTPSVNSVTVTPGTVDATVGTAIIGQQLTANVSVTGGASQDVVWSVHDAGTTGTGKVTVDADGKLNVAADAAIGTAVIRATSTYDSTKYGICPVSVAPIAPSGVTLDTAAVTLSVDGSQSLPETWQLTATVSPSDATDKSVTWSSDAPDVANVDDTGLVTAHSAGTATITVTTADGSQTDTCTVRVGSLAASNAEAAKITGFAVGNNDSSHLCFNAGGYDTLTSGAGIALVEVRAGAASPGSVVDFDAELTGKTLAFHTQDVVDETDLTYVGVTFTATYNGVTSDPVTLDVSHLFGAATTVGKMRADGAKFPTDGDRFGKFLFQTKSMLPNKPHPISTSPTLTLSDGVSIAPAEANAVEGVNSGIEPEQISLQSNERGMLQISLAAVPTGDFDCWWDGRIELICDGTSYRISHANFMVEVSVIDS